jgi:hypothetical protein
MLGPLGLVGWHGSRAPSVIHTYLNYTLFFSFLQNMVY